MLLGGTNLKSVVIISTQEFRCTAVSRLLFVYRRRTRCILAQVYNSLFGSVLITPVRRVTIRTRLTCNTLPSYAYAAATAVMSVAIRYVLPVYERASRSGQTFAVLKQQVNIRLDNSRS